MKLLITSDVHGRLDDLKCVVEKHKDCDLHLNAGDMSLDPRYYEFLNIITVKGNNDFGVDLPLERIIEKDGCKILLIHGHKESVKFGLTRLKLKAKILGANIVIFGHTHQKYMEMDQGILFINPGALSDGHRTYAIYENQTVTFLGL